MKKQLKINIEKQNNMDMALVQS